MSEGSNLRSTETKNESRSMCTIWRLVSTHQKYKKHFKIAKNISNLVFRKCIMETKQTTAAYNINVLTYSDYLLVISLPDEVKEMVRKYKLSSAKVIGNFDSMHSIAHISVTNQYRQMPVTMGQKLGNYQRFVIRLKPIELRISGFAYFQHGRSGFTIYAKIEMDAEVNKWFAHLKRIFGDKQSMTPHITIAKNIPPHAFKTLWPYFVTREYRHTFVPDKLTVLYRPSINTGGAPWQPFKELSFSK